MSWGVSAHGNVLDVQVQLEQQFKAPLADAPAGITDEGERATVYLVSRLILQCLGTFDANRIVSVNAYGHMGGNLETRQGLYQTVSVQIS